MNAPLKSLVALAVGAAGFSVASLQEPPPQPDPEPPVLNASITYSVHHRTGAFRSSYITATDPSVGEVRFIVGPSKSALGDETQVALKPSDSASALEIVSQDGAVYADCRSLTLAKAESIRSRPDDARTRIMREFSIPWWVLRSKTAAAGADGTDIIMQRVFVGPVTNPKNEVTRILFLGPEGSSVRTAWWNATANVWVQGPSLGTVNTYTELRYINNAWTFSPPVPIDDGQPAVSDVEQILIRMTNLKSRAVGKDHDDPNNGG